MGLRLRLGRAAEGLGRQSRLDQVAEPVQQAIGKVFGPSGLAGTRINDFLHGVWLGHPLHPALTDVPIGAWTVAAILDGAEALGGNAVLGTAADAAIAIGALGATGAVVSGIADWQYYDGPVRRIGLVHALLNTTALGLYVASLMARGGGKRGQGRCLAFLGYGITSFSGDLGGHMVFSDLAGTDHAAAPQLPTDWTRVMAEADLPAGKPVGAEANGQPVVLVREDGRIFCLYATCAHLGGPLPEGRLEDGGIVCPWHGSCFALDDGRVLKGPSPFPEPCLDVRVENGQIEVRASQPAQV